VISAMLTPSQPHSTLPLDASCGTRTFTRFDGIAKPIDPLRAAMLFTPTTSPAMLTSGPPEFPGLMAASVWMKSNPGRGDAERRALAADDPEAHRLLETEGVTQREHELADADAVGVREAQRRQVLDAIDLDQREIHAIVTSNHLAAEPAPVREPHLDPVGCFHDVGVGDDQSLGRDDEARSARPPRLARRLGVVLVLRGRSDARGRARAPASSDRRDPRAGH
jgi:hypothetical protein